MHCFFMVITGNTYQNKNPSGVIYHKSSAASYISHYEAPVAIRTLGEHFVWVAMSKERVQCTFTIKRSQAEGTHNKSVFNIYSL